MNFAYRTVTGVRSARRGILTVATAGIVAVSAAAWTVSGADSPAAVAVSQPSTPVTSTTGVTPGSYADVLSKVMPAVVTVRSEARARSGRDFFAEQFGEGRVAPERRQGGLGSGVIVSADGYILTNQHVVDGASAVKVELHDRRTMNAVVVGSDPPSDLALLKIDAAGLQPLTLGDAGHVRVGDVVFAVGNPLGVGQTVTMGIISAKGRATGLGDGSFEDFLQTDAPINAGNSGGALVNTRGELVGINSQILSPSGGNIGIGFSIPVDMAKAVMDSLVKNGRVRRGRLGVTVQQVTPELATSLQLDQIGGALINGVEAGGPAERAGVRQGDVVVAVNGAAVLDNNMLRNKVAQLGPDAKVTLAIVRQGQRQEVTATLGELPSTADATRPTESNAAQAAGLVVEPLSAERARQLGLSGSDTGLLVTRVLPEGHAADAGFRAGDVIQRVDGEQLDSAAELKSALNAGARPALVLVRRGEHSLYLTLERRAA